MAIIFLIALTCFHSYRFGISHMHSASAIRLCLSAHIHACLFQLLVCVYFCVFSFTLICSYLYSELYLQFTQLSLYLLNGVPEPSGFLCKCVSF